MPTETTAGSYWIPQKNRSKSDVSFRSDVATLTVVSSAVTDLNYQFQFIALFCKRWCRGEAMSSPDVGTEIPNIFPLKQTVSISKHFGRRHGFAPTGIVR